MDSGLPVCRLGAVLLGDDSEYAVAGDSLSEAFGDSLFLGFCELGAGGDVEQERNAGIELVYVLSAGAAAAGELEIKLVFGDFDAFFDFYHGGILANVRDVGR